MQATRLIITSAALLAILPAVWAEEDGPRQQLAALERALVDAVSRVSLPADVPMLGVGGSCRGYRLQGVGAWFVISPRALPRQATHQSRPDADSAGGKHEGAGPSAKHQDRQKPRGGTPRLEERRRAQEVLAAQERARAMQEAADEARLEAQAALDMLQRAIGERMGPGGLTLGAEPQRAVGGPPAAQPWLWESPGPRENTPSPDELIGSVRDAISETLERDGPSLLLRGEEAIVVAVDFFGPSPMPWTSSPARTLLVRAPMHVLEARHSGALSPADARKQFEVALY